jgi:hypothetical protein
VDTERLAALKADCSYRDWSRFFAPGFEFIVVIAEHLAVGRSQHRDVGHGLNSSRLQAERRAALGHDGLKMMIAEHHPAIAVPVDAVRGGDHEPTRNEDTLAATSRQPHRRCFHDFLEVLG